VKPFSRSLCFSNLCNIILLTFFLNVVQKIIAWSYRNPYAYTRQAFGKP
jgi:hypothetical protein